MLLDPLHEFVWIGHYLRDQVVLIVVLQVVDFLQIFVVLLGHTLYIRYQALVLQVKPPVFAVVVGLLGEFRHRRLHLNVTAYLLEGLLVSRGSSQQLDLVMGAIRGLLLVLLLKNDFGGRCSDRAGGG